jgi:hypothetical protein
LARQTDNREWHSYINDLYVRRDRLKRAFAVRGLDVPELDNLASAGASDEKIKRIPLWHNLSLDQLAERRDKLEGITNSKLDAETLRTLYDSIYRQGSSVSHYDLYSIQMLGVYEGPTGPVLAADPALPIVTVLHCALFDLIQCAEALAKLQVPAPPELWDTADEAWWKCVKQTGIMEIGGSG